MTEQDVERVRIAGPREVALPGARGALPRLVHRWRHFRGGDPGLAVVMSPSAWPAPLAGQVFSGPAGRVVAECPDLWRCSAQTGVDG